jgi:serine/threonine protein phosphatase PrpC
MTKIQTVAKTHVGQVRDHNEDSFIVGLNPVSDGWMVSTDEFEIGDKGSVLIVADGMGGENAGEIAAEIAVQSIKAYIQAEVKKEVPQAPNKILESAIIYAHNCIKDACRDNAEYIGMGTTVTVCMLQKDKIFVSWIGDTRVYRYSKHGRVHALPYHFNNLEILSEDHSKVWQMMVQGQLSLEGARTHEQSNIITQSLGDLFHTPQPESREYPLFKDDHILICSDGLNGMLSDENIERIFTSEYESLDKIAEQMITEANLAGGHDNITLILTKVTEGILYSEDIAKKGSGEKTMMTEALPKKKNKVLTDFIIATTLATVLFLGYHYRNQWLPLFKKPNTKPQDTTSIKIDTPQTVPNVTPPKPLLPKSPKIETPKQAGTPNIVAPAQSSTNTTNGKQKPPANEPNYKPKPKDESQPKLVNDSVHQNKQIDTTNQNKR